jgi:hypothetical protein
MKIFFNKKKFKKLALEKYGKYENFAKTLTEQYDLEKSKDAVTRWGQETSINVPTAHDLPIVAEALGVTVNDLYENAEEANQRIVKNALENPSAKIEEMLNNYFNISPFIKGDIVGDNNEGHRITYLPNGQSRPDRRLEEIIEAVLENKYLKNAFYAEVLYYKNEMPPHYQSKFNIKKISDK